MDKYSTTRLLMAILVQHCHLLFKTILLMHRFNCVNGMRVTPQSEVEKRKGGGGRGGMGGGGSG